MQSSQGQQGTDRDRDTRASSLLSLLSGGQPSQQQQTQQVEQGIYPISTPQPYPPSTGSVTSNFIGGGGTSASSSSGDAASSVNTETPTTRSTISVDSLFRNIAGSGGGGGPGFHQGQDNSDLSDQYHSAGDNNLFQPHPSTTNTSTTNNANASGGQGQERQNALLSLLGNVASPPLSDAGSATVDQRANNASSSAEQQQNQSRFLLDTLLPGHQQQPQQQQQSFSQGAGSLSNEYEREYSGSGGYTAPRSASNSPSHTQTQTSPAPAHPQPDTYPGQQGLAEAGGAGGVLDPTSQTSRKSRFEYYSPFDALSSMPPSQSAPAGVPFPTSQNQSPQTGLQGLGGQGQGGVQQSVSYPQSLPSQQQQGGQGQGQQLNSSTGSQGSVTRKKPVPPVDPTNTTSTSTDYAYNPPPVGALPAIPTSQTPPSQQYQQQGYQQQSQQQQQQQPLPPSQSQNYALTNLAPGQRPTSPRITELQQQAGIGGIGMQQFPRYSPDSVHSHHSSGRERDVRVGSEGDAGSGGSGYPAGGPRMSPMHHPPPTSQSPSYSSYPQQQPQSQQQQQQGGSPAPMDAPAESSNSASNKEGGSERERERSRRREDLRPTGNVGKSAGQPQGGQTQVAKPLRGSPSVDHSAPTYNLNMDEVLTPIAAAPGLSAVTPIALLRLENVYSPGTTIGVSSFIAYAMTRGRVRLIARSNGSRSLLHLPPTFSSQVSATDMVVSGTYLACVTSDGGLVIWDVPHELDENPPVPVVLHVSPPPPGEAPYALRLVKWHPRQAAANGGNNATNNNNAGNGNGTTNGTIAVASDREVYVFNVQDALERFGGEEVSLGDLATISSVINVPSPLVGFTFDHPQVALATISIDSTIILWSIKDRLPFWQGRVPGEGLPSSIDFLEGGLLVGRKQGTVLQLLPVMSATVAATVKLNMPSATANNNGGKGKDSAAAAGPDEESIFAHVAYDPRIKTIWAAHSARPSLFAIRLAFDTSNPSVTATSGSEVQVATAPVIEQIVEFPIPMQCINMAILVSPASDASSLEEAQIHNFGLEGVPPPTPGGMNGTAVASFAMHQGGVDQINIAMNTFENALASTPAKLPPATYGPEFPPQQSQQQHTVQKKGNNNSSSNQAQSVSSARGAAIAASAGFAGEMPLPAAARPRSPVSEGEGGATLVADVAPKKQPKSGNSGAKASASASNKEKEKSIAAAKESLLANTEPPRAAAEVGVSQATLAKDLRKVEDNLHQRFGKLLSKELDRQQQRIEDLRRADQEADFARQETILKLISTELTKNTTRVVEQAIKSEVQNTVLPALEAITKNEIKAALGGQVAKGIADTLKQALPIELERLLLRPEISTHIARNFTQTVTPLVERQVRESFTKTLIPAYQQMSQDTQVDLARSVQAEIINLKKEIVTWQADAIRGTEMAVRDMEQNIRSLNDQIRSLHLQMQNQGGPPSHLPSGISPAHRNSPGTGVLPPQPIQSNQQNLQHPLPHQHVSTSSHLRQGTLGAFNSSNALPALLSQQLPPPPGPNQQQQPQQQNVLQQPQPTSWQQAPGPVQPPPGPPQQQQQQQQYQPPPQQPIGSYQQQTYKQQAPPPQQIPQQAAPVPRALGAAGEDWDDIFLATLQRQDPRQLRDLLARCNPDIIMPAKRELSPIGQAVVLTLIHRLTESLPDLSPNDDALHAALWWLQRSAYTLNPSDPMIDGYVTPVLNTSQSILDGTANRLNGYPELQNTIRQIQHTLSIKP